MNILVLSPRDPIPVYTGLLERIYQTYQYLGSENQVCVCFPNLPSQNGKEEGRFPDKIAFERVCLESPILDLFDKNIPHYSWLRGIYQTHPWLYRAVHEQINSFEPDVIIVEMPFLVPLASMASHGRDIPLVLTEHNVQFKITERLDIPGTRALRWFESAVGNRVDYVLTVSETDRETLDKHILTPILVSPNGVDTTKYSPKNEPIDQELLEQDRTDEPLFVYHGSLGNAQNSEAIDLLVDRIFPTIRKKYPNAQLMLIGSDPPNIEQEGVFTTGLVDDLPSYIASADVALVPLLSGSGTKLKILEYMASGVPVVTTSIGAEGLPIEDGTHAYIEDNWEDFVKKAEKLVGSRGLYKRLASNARTLVENKFSWEETLRPYDQILDEVRDSKSFTNCC
ncbi:glycosyltransferase family 4 protein [Haladaptatus sp. DYSN1]|uniref:glycosyltransferase family 4 protein n=1 Tax=unclassified Haladaptatus TaxID=2622732 RepID=UPI00240533FE|nr:glycosyltransferase family 4 protein [Haladaptatus sp. DYSN1]